MIKNPLNFSIIIIGNEQAGKTALRRTYLGESFKQNYQSTLGIDVTVKKYNKEKISGVISIWDMGGQAFYKHHRGPYYNTSAGIIIVFDVTEEFDYNKQIECWLQEKEEFAYDTNMPTVILANKIDLKDFRQITKSDLKKLSSRIQLEFNYTNEIHIFETSAKTGGGVQEAFESLVSESIKWTQKVK